MHAAARQVRVQWLDKLIVLWVRRTHGMADLPARLILVGVAAPHRLLAAGIPMLSQQVHNVEDHAPILKKNVVSPKTVNLAIATIEERRAGIVAMAGSASINGLMVFPPVLILVCPRRVMAACRDAQDQTAGTSTQIPLRCSVGEVVLPIKDVQAKAILAPAPASQKLSPPQVPLQSQHTAAAGDPMRTVSLPVLLMAHALRAPFVQQEDQARVSSVAVDTNHLLPLLRIVVLE